MTERLKVISGRLDEEIARTDKLRLLKAGLMQDLLTGGVRVPEEAVEGVAV